MPAEPITLDQDRPLAEFVATAPVMLALAIALLSECQRNAPLLEFLNDCPKDISEFGLKVGLITQVCIIELRKGKTADMSRPFEVALQEILSQEAPDSITLLKTAAPGLAEGGEELRAVSGIAAALWKPDFSKAVWAAFGIIAERLAEPPKTKGESQ